MEAVLSITLTPTSDHPSGAQPTTRGAQNISASHSVAESTIDA